MFQKLEAVEERYEELNKKISDPEIIARNDEWRNYMKEHANLVDLVEKYREYKKAKNGLEEAKQMLEDKDLKELAEMEMLEAKEKLPIIEEQLKIIAYSLGCSIVSLLATILVLLSISIISKHIFSLVTSSNKQ